MFHEERRTVPESVAELHSEYAADLRAAVESVGTEEAVERTGLDRSAVEAVATAEDASDLPDLTLAEAAELQALAEGTAGPETIVEMACDHLLLGMSTAVLDVDTVASELSVELTPKEVQQKLERRAPMSFAEFVAVQFVIAGRQR